jgi:pimeloyl-ACP methyl ester carboxylesterase
VGWSYGGLNMRLYAYMYPAEVGGLVMVDSGHERQLEAFGGGPNPALMAAFRMLPRLIATGVPALVPQWVPRTDAGQLPDEAVLASQALAVMSPKMAEAVVDELQGVEASMAQVAAARAALPGPQPLGDLPLVVLMKGQAESIVGVSLSAEGQQQVWLELQQDLTQQSSKGQLIVAERSGHNIPYTQPELVVAAVEQVLQIGESHAR